MRESVIKRLIKLVEESQIEELEISRWGKMVRISKKARATPASPAEPGAAEVIAASAAPPEQKALKPELGEKKTEGLPAIKSPMVGTFYRASAPGAEPFVKLGQVIEKGQVVCIVEAMKLMNEIESDVSGRIAKILVEDTQPVEYGQELFFVEPG
jgi:acetyl-CoA carboxylase biotin carboxyl carrier protein